MLDFISVLLNVFDNILQLNMFHVLFASFAVFSVMLLIRKVIFG